MPSDNLPGTVSLGRNGHDLGRRQRGLPAAFQHHVHNVAWTAHGESCHLGHRRVQLDATLAGIGIDEDDLASGDVDHRKASTLECDQSRGGSAPIRVEDHVDGGDRLELEDWRGIEVADSDGTKSTALMIGGIVGDVNPGSALVVPGVLSVAMIVGEVTSGNVVATAPSGVASAEV